MINRRSNAADLPALQSLWQEVFGDPPAFTGRFYEAFGADSAIVSEEEGKIVAMLHPLPVALAQNGRCSFGVYIYALATHPDHRGKGIASRLLTEAETAPFPIPPALAKADTVGLCDTPANAPAFSLLIPAKKSLFDYYRTRGYVRHAKIVSEEAESYPAHLAQGLSDQPVFLKPEPFYALAAKIPEPVPPPVEHALWKPLAPGLTDGEPNLSHFMQ